MRNREYDRCRRFEERYGIGSILDVIQKVQSGQTYKLIAAELSESHHISEGQLVQYLKTFICTFYYPSEQVKKYYYIKNKLDQEKSVGDMMEELRSIDNEAKLIYVNFRKNSQQLQGHRA